MKLVSEQRMSKKLKQILILLSFILVTAISVFSLGIAYAGGIRGIGLVGIWFFLTFGIIIVLAQLIPAGILLSSFIGTSFVSTRRNEVPVEAT